MTLALACLFAAGWVRSLIVEDSIVTTGHQDFPHHRGILAAGWINSHHGQIERVTSVAVGRNGKPMAGTGYRLWSIHYRSIVVPLTLLSAWLLLSKPRGKTLCDLGVAGAGRAKRWKPRGFGKALQPRPPQD